MEPKKWQQLCFGKSGVFIDEKPLQAGVSRERRVCTKVRYQKQSGKLK
jgi:hypothetical protein